MEVAEDATDIEDREEVGREEFPWGDTPEILMGKDAVTDEVSPVAEHAGEWGAYWVGDFDVNAATN